MSVKEREQMPIKPSRQAAIEGTIIGGLVIILVVLYLIVVFKGGLL